MGLRKNFCDFENMINGMIGRLKEENVNLEKQKDDFAEKLSRSEFSGHAREDVHQNDSK